MHNFNQLPEIILLILEKDSTNVHLNAKQEQLFRKSKNLQDQIC